MPDFALECSAGGIVAGVDEAGRGPLAGPVVAAAVIFDAHVSNAGHPPATLDGLDDSKCLARSRRLRMFDVIMASASVGIGAASVAEIDRLNILGAALLAMKRAVAALPIVPDIALVDGNRSPDLPCPGVCIVGGDGRSLSIAAASVIAKVTRDRAMTKLDAIFPEYGWERNAGYGTAEHLAALDRCGPTRHHRQSFRPVATRAAVWAKTHTVAPRRLPADR